MRERGVRCPDRGRGPRSLLAAHAHCLVASRWRHACSQGGILQQQQQHPAAGINPRRNVPLGPCLFHIRPVGADPNVFSHDFWRCGQPREVPASHADEGGRAPAGLFSRRLELGAVVFRGGRARRRRGVQSRGARADGPHGAQLRAAPGCGGDAVRRRNGRCAVRLVRTPRCLFWTRAWQFSSVLVV